MGAEKSKRVDNFKVIYRILKALEAAMDYDEFDMDMISHEKLGISENRWAALLREMVRSGYIDGISVSVSVDGILAVSISNPSITIQGLEYLENNSLIKKVANAAKGIKQIVPGL